MGFLTRLIAGLVSAATLGMGVAGTTPAVADTSTKTTGTVETTADTTTNLPDHLVNGDFEYDANAIKLSETSDNWTYVTSQDGMYWHSGNWEHGVPEWRSLSGFDKARFSWNSTQKDGDTSAARGDGHKANAVELQQDLSGNKYGELCAYEAGTAIYQDLKTVPGTLYKIRLKHASLYSGYLDKMQVMIGAPGHEQAVEMTRTSVNGNGDKLGEKSTTIATKVSNAYGRDGNRDHDSQWETYEGYYIVPDGQTTTRFTFKSVDAKDRSHGNLLDDIVFNKAYRLSYDKNADDASGSVPANERGKENTVQPAKAETTGSVRTVADDTSGLPDHLVNGDFQTYGNEIINKRTRPTSLFMNFVDGNGNVMQDVITTPWTKISGWSATKFGWKSDDKLDGHSNLIELQRPTSTKSPSSTANVWAEIAAASQGKYIYQDIATTPGTMYKWSIKHASRNTGSDDSMQVMIGEPGKETAQQATRDTSNGSDSTGGVGTTITTHGTAQDGQWETYSGTYIATGTVTRFTFKSMVDSNHSGSTDTAEGNCIDDVMFTKAYKLTYDKNASDASGSVPSNEPGKENATQPAKAKTNGTVKTVADDTSNLPDHLVNGDFSVNYKDQWLTGGWSWTSITPDGKYLNSVRNWNDSATVWKTVNGWDRSRFGWSSTQKDGTDNIQHKAGAVELQYDSQADNVYAELCAYEAGTAIYQDLKTVPGTLYKIRLKHASLYSGYLDKMQVMIGAPGHEQAVEMTRTSVNGNGDKLGEKSTTIATKVSNTGEADRNHENQWETYEGTYVIPAGQTTTRFTFKSVDARSMEHGNLLDDIVFDKAYRLDYDKNAGDAKGSIPSNTTVNTVQPAKATSTGAVRLAADNDDEVTTYAANNLPKQLVNSDFDHDWQNIVSQSKMTDKYNFANVDPAHGDVEISGALNSKGEASKEWVHLNGFDSSKFGWKSNQTDTKVDGRGGIVEIQRSKANDNMYAEITASQANTYLYQDIDTAHSVPTVYTVRLRYAHRNGAGNSNEKIQILVGAPGHEQPVTMTRIATQNNNKVGEKSTTVDAPGSDGWLGRWDTFQGSVTIPAGQDTTRFTFKALGSIDGVSGNLIDDVQFKLAYPLVYDKNADDASGRVPSNTAADTTQTVASRTDGTVKSLVQRTTTHEDGSVTVRTVDSDTDVVQGCQVYYPAGQRITLATMAKDGDCWDSGMLTRPGHTQLGWNQDRDATTAQSEVTMVEGGMTVYAVWTGNPTLTYDTNKPDSWNGEMPSTPASVSVPYNTAATDGSGWTAGDTSKLRGYRFLGWYSTPQDGSNLYDWNTPLTANTTVYAHWERLRANVLYDANGGEGSHEKTAGWQYSDVTVPADTSKSFTRDGYEFLGWNTQKDGKGTDYADGSQVPLQDTDVTLYAQWRPVHTVLNPTGGVGLPLLLAGGGLLMLVGIGATVRITRRRPDDGASVE